MRLFDLLRWQPFPIPILPPNTSVAGRIDPTTLDCIEWRATSWRDAWRIWRAERNDR